MRNQFEKQLKELNNILIEMGALIESRIAKAVKSLEQQDTELAKAVMSGDNEVDQKEKQAEELCLKILLKQQPVAKDLRSVSAALKMITDMERIGDQAADIAEITLMLVGTPYIENLENINRMTQATVKMLGESIDAFVKRDEGLARSVIAHDDIVDDLFCTVRSDLIDLSHKDKVNGEQAIDLIMIAKYLERIGDHAENIAEWVLFSITGTHEDFYG